MPERGGRPESATNVRLEMALFQNLVISGTFYRTPSRTIPGEPCSDPTTYFPEDERDPCQRWKRRRSVSWSHCA